MHEAITVVVADDEPPARRTLRRLLEREPDFEVVGEAGSGVEAIERIHATEPDAVFLDIKMPGATGLEVVASLDLEPIPITVFVTAYDAYAVQAFEAAAVDYVLKPVAADRLATSLDRIRKLVAAGRHPAKRDILEQLQHPGAPWRYARRILVRETHRLHFVEVSGIDWIEAAGNYCYLRTAQRSHLVRLTLRELEGVLDPANFVRVHRSAIVNIAAVEEVVPEGAGDYSVRLRGGGRCRVSRSYRDLLKRKVFV